MKQNIPVCHRCSVWKSGLVQFSAYFWEDQDWDQSTFIPNQKKTGLDHLRLVLGGFLQS